MYLMSNTIFNQVAYAIYTITLLSSLPILLKTF
jgi:hypothetical protein